MGRPNLEYIEGYKIYICRLCETHLSCENWRLSKQFTGGSGRAFLFDYGLNYHVGEPQNKRLLTGIHTVQDLICDGCDKVIGWKYIKAQEEDQKYKEGKIIIERAYVNKIKWSK